MGYFHVQTMLRLKSSIHRYNDLKRGGSSGQWARTLILTLLTLTLDRRGNKCILGVFLLELSAEPWVVSLTMKKCFFWADNNLEGKIEWLRRNVWVMSEEGGACASWNHMAHGPCIHEYFWWPEYEYRLGRQVGAPLWFTKTLPLKTFLRQCVMWMSWPSIKPHRKDTCHVK